MNRISEITKRDIFELFQNGIDINVLWDVEKITYPYFGRLEEIDFLKRLYDLNNMSSKDTRYSDAEGDIRQHTINDDYPFCWVFEDERFGLKDGTDEEYLKFICEIFHPAVRIEKEHWKEFYDKVNQLLKNDMYELYPSEKISNRDVYSWRIFSPEENNMFIPYSLRNEKDIKKKKLVLSIKRNVRNQIYQLLERYNNVYQETDVNGCKYYVETREQVIYDIKKFYIPMCYNRKNQYVETDNLQDFVCYSVPYYVIDVIEFFEKYNYDNNFESEVNAMFKLNNINLKLSHGKVENTFTRQIINSTLAQIQEAGLKELLQEAANYYDKGNINIAVEKLWDAFERLKTYYSPNLDKKKSVNKIISNMSGSQEHYKELFEKEFSELTSIGNNFRIRHHETTKINIEDNRHYDYFYRRCISLISVATQYLHNEKTF
ncbi:hypothetical protein KQI18_03660 [Clostridioides mangenotii]|uniref:AbiJ-related protein n=1 Tax=Metaclostridioides mangenotii TaxID=1540 RepID=UPI001C10E079|nr:hypothetical protein [Clostridioides mangenotii]